MFKKHAWFFVIFAFAVIVFAAATCTSPQSGVDQGQGNTTGDGDGGDDDGGDSDTGDGDSSGGGNYTDTNDTTNIGGGTQTRTTELTGLVMPGDLEYLGAFRLPGGEDRPLTFGYGGSAMTYYPGGDAGGAADGFSGSLFISGHERLPYGELPDGNQVAEVSIPVPSTNLQTLPTAEFVQTFHDVSGGLFLAYDELPRMSMVYMSHPSTGPKIHLTFGEHFHEDEVSMRPTHGYFDPDMEHPNTQGAWYIGNQSLYTTNEYLFEIPSDWANTYTEGRNIATGRYRQGGWSGQGPALFAYAPWYESSLVPDGRLHEKTLLLYNTVYEGELTGDLNNYQHVDYWSGGAWLTTSSKATVIFVGTKSSGAYYWYGYGHADGPNRPCLADDLDFVGCRNADGTRCADNLFARCDEADHITDKGWWGSNFDAQIIFYDPANFASVAHGTMNANEPQPYAVLDIDEHLILPNLAADIAFSNGSGDQRVNRVRAVAYDRANNLLYILEPFADGIKPVVHVWRVN